MPAGSLSRLRTSTEQDVPTETDIHMAEPDGLHYKGIRELAGLYRKRAVSPVEVTEAFLDRIRAYQDGTLAYITVTEDRARADAKAAEAALTGGNDLGPLHGIPLALKDLCDTAGIRTTSGSKGREHHIPQTSSTVAKRLARAGAVLLGKTNMVEYAFGPYGVNAHFGTPPNPWDPERVPGGSSSGSGVAVSGGLATAAIGTDTGGSVRIPASYCGIVGLKTTLGRVGTEGVTPLSWSLDTVGPMTRSVEDAAFLFEAIAGPEPGDQTALALSCDGVAAGLSGDVRGMRLGVPHEPFFDDADPEVVALVNAAIEKLGSLGAQIGEMAFPEAVQAEQETDNLVLLRTEAYTYHREALAAQPEGFSERVRARLELDSDVKAADFIDIQKRRSALMQSAKASLAAVDALVAPTMLTVAPRLADLDKGEPAKLVTRLVNWLGLCAVSVPCGFTPDGLPVGLQLIGKPFDEARILRLAHAYEQATDWHPRTPPGF